MMGLFVRGADVEPVGRGFSAHRDAKPASRPRFLRAARRRSDVHILRPVAGADPTGTALAGLVTGSISTSSVISTATPMVTALGLIVVALVIAPLWGMRMLRAIA